jgi:hypothetical protein
MDKKNKIPDAKAKTASQIPGVASDTETTGSVPVAMTGDCSVAVVNGMTFANPEDVDKLDF